jgi:hypothetical protein
MSVVLIMVLRGKAAMVQQCGRDVCPPPVYCKAALTAEDAEGAEEIRNRGKQVQRIPPKTSSISGVRTESVHKAFLPPPLFLCALRVLRG